MSRPTFSVSELRVGSTSSMLQDQQALNVYDVFRLNPPPGWEPLFDIAKHELLKVSKVLADKERNEGTFYPHKKDIFRAFHLIRPEDVSVVIFGQDPYPQTLPDGTPRCTGLAFSQKPSDDVAVSMQNIFREVKRTTKDYEMPDNADLEGWVKQGVMLLNACLTVKPGQPKSHGGIWKPFITKAISYLNDINPNVLYVLWGRDAQQLQGEIIPSACDYIEGPHPAARPPNSFVGCGHFREINEWLAKKGKKQVKW